MAEPAKVLVVEDERVTATDITATLRSFGYIVSGSAASGAEALRLAAVDPPDLALMDINLSGDIDGIETARQLRERCHIPVVYLTAYADPETIERAKQTSPFGYILKPFSRDEVRFSIEIALMKHRIETLLVERDRWLRATLASMEDAVVTTNGKGQVTFMNPLAERLTGWDQDAALGRDFAEVIKLMGDDGSGPRETGGSKESVLVRKDGATKAVAETSSPLVDAAGAVLGAVVVFHDISEQKKVQERLLVADRHAVLGTMAGGITHAINNPLAVVLSNLGLVSQELKLLAADCQNLASQLPETAINRLQERLRQSEDALAEIRQGADRVQHVVRELQVFASADENRLKPLVLSQVLDATLQLAYNEIRHRARLVKNYEAMAPILGSEARLSQLFLNLLITAAHTIRPGDAANNELRVIAKMASADEAQVEIVTTTSAASTPERSASEPFGLGLGLGLSVCRNIVEELGGQLLTRTEPGTQFLLTLPTAKVVARPAAKPRHVTSTQRRGRVLVVDDEPGICRSLRRLLVPHAVVDLTSAKEALVLLGQDDNFDVILCDLMMPEMTGMQFWSSLNDSGSNLGRKVVFLTGGAFADDARDFLARTANRYLEKPFKSDELLEVVRNHIN